MASRLGLLVALAFASASGAGVRHRMRRTHAPEGGAASFGLVFPVGQRYTGGPANAATTEAIAKVDAAKSALTGVQMESDKASEAYHAARSGYQLVQESRKASMSQLKADPTNETVRGRAPDPRLALRRTSVDAVL